MEIYLILLLSSKNQLHLCTEVESPFPSFFFQRNCLSGIWELCTSGVQGLGTYWYLLIKSIF
uniref:Uncharacterized protein n=1 Tax=Rhizophora mucronata TaxID=61149 RepID=A0A2P2J168_RHIMU